MLKGITILFIVIYLSGLLAAACNAQYYSLNNTYSKKSQFFLKAGNWDSAYYYGLKMQENAEKIYGWVSPENAEALANRAGPACWYTGNRLQARLLFKKGISVYEALQHIADTNSDSLHHILARWGGDIIALHTNWGRALLQYGVHSGDWGSFTEEMALLTKAGPLLKEVKDWGEYAECQLNIAITYTTLGELTKAGRIYDSMGHLPDSVFDKSPAWREYLNMCIQNNIAELYSQTGNFKKQLLYVKNAETLLDTSTLLNNRNFFNDKIQLLLNVADAYKNMHYYDSALQKCLQVEDSLKSKNHADLYAGLLQQLAGIYLANHSPAQAVEICRLSLKIMDSLAYRPNWFYHPALLTFGDACQQAGMYILADSVWRVAILDMYAHGRTRSYEFQQALTGLCRSLFYQGKTKEAADSLLTVASIALRAMQDNFEGLPEADKLQYEVAGDNIFDMLYSLMAKGLPTNNNIKKIAFQLQLQHKNMVLTSQAALLNRLRQNNDTGVANIVTSWLATRQMLAKQYSLAYADRLLNTDSLELVSETLEKIVSEKNYTGMANSKAGSTGSFIKQDKTVANIEFVRYNALGKNIYNSTAHYAAFVLRGGDSIPTFVPLCSEEALIRLIGIANNQNFANQQAVQQLYAPGTPQAKALFMLLWQPLQQYLGGAKYINYSPAGLLNNIAFNALCNKSGCLMASYTLYCFGNLANAAVKKNATNTPKGISMWGNIDYNNAIYAQGTKYPKSRTATDVPQLNGPDIKPALQLKNLTKKPLENLHTNELPGIKKIFDGKAAYCTVENAYATEDSFKHAAYAINGVLHISTHGFYTAYNKAEAEQKLPGSFIAANTNPLFRCGLAFAGVNHYWMNGQPLPGHDDGILTGYEISQLDLHNVQLVALSACETGLGDVTATEGNLGLQRAFKLAGAQNLLVSLWQVPAKQTARLLAKFYKYWLNGQTPAAALQAAQNDLRAEGRIPYEWAGFVLVE